MTDTISTEWLGDMTLETTIDGHKIKMDAEAKFGGQDAGPRPKPLMLSALSGCTGMDVISILAKKKVQYKSFRINVTGEKAEEYPKPYTKIHVIYEFTGAGFVGNIDIISKIQRAVELSMDKYCGTADMLRKACELTWEIRLADS